MKIGTRAGVTVVAAMLMAGSVAAGAHAQVVNEGPGDVFVFAPGDGNNVVVGNDNNVAGRDNAVGSGHTTGTGHTLTGDDGTEVGSPPPAVPYGTVISPSGVNTHQRPTTASPIVGTLRDEERVALDCKVRGQNIDGNDIWYKLRFRPSWVTARYVVNTGAVPFCAAESAPQDARQNGNRAMARPLG